MKNFRFLLFGFSLLLFSAALPLHAQGPSGGVDSGGSGDTCVESPENPTAILALLGSASAFCVSARARIKARRYSK
jgi:XrtJ-associated TM-motif-TM protein